MSPAPASPDETAERRERRRRRLFQELALRASVALLILLFDRVYVTVTAYDEPSLLSRTALAVLLLNVPYWLLGRAGRWGRTQAYGRMLLDVAFITLGLGAAGGLAAAPFIGVYVVVPAYVGLVLSRTAALVATAASVVAYLTLVILQEGGWIGTPPRPDVGERTVAAFNLLMLAVVGVVIALLGEAYRRSRSRLARLNRELERAAEETMRLNAEIQRAARLSALGEVTAGVTHELGNLLTSAVGHLNLARRKLRGGAGDAEEHFAHLERSFEAATRIVRNALETARQPVATVEAISLPEVARRIAELKAPELRRQGITVRVDFPGDFPPVRGAPFQLQQILLNLVSNAQHALREARAPRAIEIAGSAHGDRAVVEVRDNRPGIPPAALERLFEPFFTTRPEGTGLGLAISAGIARGLGGELSAANRPGGGAVFRLDLPAERLARR